MLPSNIVGMAHIKGLDLIALTDHNSCLNCEPVLKLASKYGIVALPGMELCTAEEVHVLCLFADLAHALVFGEFVYKKLLPVQNRPEIFGTQHSVDLSDEIRYSEPLLLTNATAIPFRQVHSLVKSFQGIMIPAHVSKKSNSLLSNLGFAPSDSRFLCAEISSKDDAYALREQHEYFKKCRLIVNSDAHSLGQIAEPMRFIYAKSALPQDILYALECIPEEN